MKNSRKPPPAPPGGAPVIRAPVDRFETRETRETRAARVTKLETPPSGVHGGTQLLDGCRETDEHCTTDDRVPDVQFFDLRNCGYRTHIGRRQSVARVDLQTERGRIIGSIDQ